MGPESRGFGLTLFEEAASTVLMVAQTRLKEHFRNLLVLAIPSVHMICVLYHLLDARIKD